jgi:exosome complex component MTR3
VSVVLQTGLIPSATGSAYLEIQPSRPESATRTKSFVAHSSSLKLTCTVHGPRPLPRSASFSSNLLLTTHVKYAPFAARRRKGHIRDTSERDLGVHLETALRGAIIAERWPKSALDVTVTVLEAEEDRGWRERPGFHDTSWGLMTVLAGCMTVASAAIADARIDCLDLIVGGVAALVEPQLNPTKGPKEQDGHEVEPLAELVLDPDPSEHQEILSACVVAYMPQRDEITELWMRGDSSRCNTADPDNRIGYELLLDGAVDTAKAIHPVLAEVVGESAGRFLRQMTHVQPVVSSAS